jgi:hypothetical protein
METARPPTTAHPPARTIQLNFKTILEKSTFFIIWRAGGCAVVGGRGFHKVFEQYRTSVFKCRVARYRSSSRSVSSSIWSFMMSRGADVFWRENVKKSIFFTKISFFQKNHFYEKCRISSKCIFTSFKAFPMIFWSEESWESILFKSKVFYPPY